MESQLSKTRRTMAGALAAGMLLAGVALAGAPAVNAAELQTTLTLNGPSSANSGENVSFKVSGTLNVGTVALLNGDQQVGQVATVGLGTQDVSFNFHTANSNMSLQAVNYDCQQQPGRLLKQGHSYLDDPQASCSSSTDLDRAKVRESRIKRHIHDQGKPLCRHAQIAGRR